MNSKNSFTLPGFGTQAHFTYDRYLSGGLRRLLLLIQLSVFCLAIASSLFLRTLPVVKGDTLPDPPTINITFFPASIPTGGTAQLSVTLQNANPAVMTLATTPYAWSDTLPTGLLFTNPPHVVDNGCGGTVTMIGSTLSLVGGSLPAAASGDGAICTVTVDVTSQTPGTLFNELRIDAAGKTTVKRTEASAAASVQLN